MPEGKPVKLPLDQLPPGGGACFVCSRQLYQDHRNGVWTFVEYEEQGYTRARHHACSELPVWELPEI